MKTKLTINGVTLELETESAAEMQEAIATALVAVLPIKSAERKYQHTPEYEAKKEGKNIKRHCVVCGQGMYWKAKTCSRLCFIKRMSEVAYNAHMRRTPEERRKISEKRSIALLKTWKLRHADFGAIKREKMLEDLGTTI